MTAPNRNRNFDPSPRQRQVLIWAIIALVCTVVGAIMIAVIKAVAGFLLAIVVIVAIIRLATTGRLLPKRRGSGH